MNESFVNKDILRELYKIVLRSEKRQFPSSLRTVSKSSKNILDEEYLRLFGDIPPSGEEINNFIENDNPFSHGLFDQNWGVGFVFVKNYLGRHDVNNFLYSVGRVPVPIVDENEYVISFPGKQYLLPVENFYVTYLTRDFNRDKIIKFSIQNMSDELFDNKAHPDLLSSYRILANRIDLTLIDKEYAKKYVLNELDFYIHKTTSLGDKAMLFSYLYANTCIMNIPVNINLDIIKEKIILTKDTSAEYGSIKINNNGLSLVDDIDQYYEYINIKIDLMYPKIKEYLNRLS